MSETTSNKYVTYFISQHHKNIRKSENLNLMGNLSILSPEDRIPESQQHSIHSYLQQLPEGTILESFTEMPENLRTNKWPQLTRAISFCKQNDSTLLIAELGSLTNNGAFSQLLINANIEFHCCDQPFINKSNLETLHRHAQAQRKRHGKLIREGLKMTSAKSGNPDAAKVISRVNKPKIDTAIVFAFVLQPIIADYKSKNFSQRQMVKALNDEGFTAPEGGKWVLSQLQKVLERVRINEISLQLRDIVQECLKQNLLPQEIAGILNNKGIPAIKRVEWDEAQVNKIIARLEQISDIENINKFVLNILPLVQTYKKDNLTLNEMLEKFHLAAKVPVRTPEHNIEHGI